MVPVKHTATAVVIDIITRHSILIFDGFTPSVFAELSLESNTFSFLEISIIIAIIRMNEPIR